MTLFIQLCGIEIVVYLLILRPLWGIIKGVREELDQSQSD